MSLIETTVAIVPLLAVPNKKPVDLGCGRLSASVSADGQILTRCEGRTSTLEADG
jgi:hypothetical protein